VDVWFVNPLRVGICERVSGTSLVSTEGTKNGIKHN